MKLPTRDPDDLLITLYIASLTFADGVLLGICQDSIKRQVLCFYMAMALLALVMLIDFSTTCLARRRRKGRDRSAWMTTWRRDGDDDWLSRCGKG